MSLKKTEWAYIAGIVDGEGSITAYNRNGCHYVRVKVGQRDPHVADWLRQKLGGSRWVEHRPARGISHAGDIHVWRAGSDLAREVLLGIFPYVVEKRLQVHVALQILGPPRPSKTEQARLNRQLRGLKKYFHTRL